MRYDCAMIGSKILQKGYGVMSEDDVVNPGCIADATDYAILQHLQKRGRITNAELAERVGLSPSAMLRRVQMLEDSGMIMNYAARLNPQKLGYKGNIFVHVSLDSQTGQALKEFEQAVLKVPQIMECYLLAGDSDYLLRVIVGGIDDYEKLHIQTLTALPHVARIRSLFTLKTVIRNTALPLHESA